MASPDPLLNIQLRTIDEEDEEPKEFAILEAIFNSQETSEDIKTNVFALKQKFNKLRLDFVTNVLLCRRDAEVKAQEMDKVTTKQLELQEDIRTANKYSEELEDIIVKLQMRLTLRDESLWTGLDHINRECSETKQELATKSTLLKDNHMYSAYIKGRNEYPEDKYMQIAMELLEGDWTTIESTFATDQSFVESMEPKPSTSTERTDVKKLEPKIVELTVTTVESEEQLNDLENKLEKISEEKICVDTDKKIQEEKRILQPEMDASKENSEESSIPQIATFESTTQEVPGMNVRREDYDALLHKYNKIQAELSAKLSQPGTLSDKNYESASMFREVSEIQGEPMAESVTDKSVETETSAVVTIRPNIEINLLSQNISQIEQELKDSRNEENSFKTEIEMLKNILQNGFKRNENLQSEIAALNNEIKALEAKTVVLEEETRTDKDNIERENSDYKRVESDLIKEQGCLEKKLCESEFERDTPLIAECNRNLQILAEANDALCDSKKLEDENDCIDSQNNALYSKNRSLKERINNMCENSQHIQGELSKLITDLTVERDQLKVTNGECSEKIKTCEKHGQDLEEKIVMLELQLQNIDTDLQLSNVNHTIEIERLEHEKYLIVAETYLLQTILLACHQDVIDNQQRRIKKLKAICQDKDNLQTKLDWRNVELLICIEKITELNNSLDETRSIIREYQTENSDIKAKLKDAEGKLIEALSNKNRMRELLEEFNNRIENFKSFITRCVCNLEFTQFVQTPSSKQEGDEPNFTGMLSTVTNLENNVDDVAETTTQSGTDISEMFANLQQKETELAHAKQQITELDSKYNAVFEELQTVKSHQESEVSPRECTQCFKLSERISSLGSRIDTIESNDVSDEILLSYKDHCDSLTKRIKQLEKEKQKLQEQLSRSSEAQYITNLENQLADLKHKYKTLKTVARVDLTEILERKAQMGYDPDQGCSTDP